MSEKEVNEMLEAYRRHIRELDHYLQQDSGRMIAGVSEVITGIEESCNSKGMQILYPEENTPSVPIKDIRDKYDALTKLSNRVKAAQDSPSTNAAEFARLMAEYRAQTDAYHSLCAKVYRGRLQSLSDGRAVLAPILPADEKIPDESKSPFKQEMPPAVKAQLERGEHLLGTHERTLNERRILSERYDRSKSLKKDTFPTAAFTRQYMRLLSRLEEYRRQEYEEKKIGYAANEMPLVDGYEKTAEAVGQKINYSPKAKEKIRAEEESLSRIGLSFEQAKRMVSSAEAVSGKRICANLEPYGEKDTADMTAQYACQVSIIVSNLYQHKVRDIYEHQAMEEKLYDGSEESIHDEASLQRYREKIENEKKATEILEKAMLSVGLLSVDREKLRKLYQDRKRQEHLLRFRPIYN